MANSTLVLAGSSQTLTLAYAQTLEGSPIPSVGMTHPPGRAGNIGQGLSRESSVYVATGITKTKTEFTDFMSKFQTMLAGQAASAIVATYTHSSGNVLLNGVNVWIEEPPIIKTRKGPEIPLADWVITMRIRE